MADSCKLTSSYNNENFQKRMVFNTPYLPLPHSDFCGFLAKVDLYLTSWSVLKKSVSGRKRL